MNRFPEHRRADCHGPRFSLSAAVVVAALLASPCHRTAWGDGRAGQPPMPPLPEGMQADSAIQPASLEVATPLPIETARTSGSPDAVRRPTPSGPMGNWSVLAAIASAFVVLAAIRFWQSRRTVRDLPGDVFEILGEAPLGSQHAVRVIRFGPRTLLVGISAAGCQTLATIDDPQATERIVGACLGNRVPRPSRGTARPSPPPVSPGGREER